VRGSTRNTSVRAAVAGSVPSLATGRGRPHLPRGRHLAELAGQRHTGELSPAAQNAVYGVPQAHRRSCQRSSTSSGCSTAARSQDTAVTGVAGVVPSASPALR
jgi:hypothetical protein